MMVGRHFFKIYTLRCKLPEFLEGIYCRAYILLIYQKYLEWMALPFPHNGPGSITSGESNNKTLNVHAQRNVFGQLVNLTGNHNLSLDAVLSYGIVVIPWALAIPDKCHLKTDKSILLQVLDKQFVLLDYG